MVMSWFRKHPAHLQPMTAEQLRRRAEEEDRVTGLFGPDCVEVRSEFDPRARCQRITVTYRDGTIQTIYPHPITKIVGNVTPRPPTPEEDRAALYRSATDLSDMPPERRATIQRGIDDAYRLAEEIRLGIRNPLR